MTAFAELIAAQLTSEKQRVAAIYRGEELPEAPMVRDQGVEMERFRLPEYFRGAPAAEVAFLGPQAHLVPDEASPRFGATAEEYIAYYQNLIPARVPFNHYDAICGDRPWLSMELPPYLAEKNLVLTCMKGRGGPEIAERSLSLIWGLLRASQVRSLVLTGADVLRWVWPVLGFSSKPLSATQGHGKVWGEVPLPWAGERTVRVVTSFHWGKEVPLFVRKVPGLGELTPREAISEARAMIGRVL